MYKILVYILLSNKSRLKITLNVVLTLFFLTLNAILVFIFQRIY
jgi:hypothetical protein